MRSESSKMVLVSVLALVTCPAFEALTVSHIKAKASILRAHEASHAEQLKRDDPKEEAKPEKKMEDPITIMRGELCWSRHALIGHKDCMEWLVEECTTHSFGTGLCNRVGKHVTEECEDKKNKQACKYAKQMGLVIDTDDDGVPDEQDAFPNDPKEWKDTDGDGVGDNGDGCPDDPQSQKKPCPVLTTPAPVAAQAPAPAAAAPSPAPKKEALAPAAAVEEKEAPAPAPKKEEPAPAKEAKEAPAAYESPDAKEGLQEQGYSGKKVLHVDGETAVSDWGKEYGHERKGSKPQKSSSMRLWQPHALTLVAGALILACSA